MRISQLIIFSFIIVALAIFSYYHFDQAAIIWVSQKHSTLLTYSGEIVQHAFKFYIWAMLAILIIIINFFRSSASFKSCLQKKSTQFFLGILFAIFICGVIKITLGRYRPELFLTQHLYGFSGHALGDRLRNSMPSDHAAIIFSIATSLSFFVRAKFIQVILFPLALILVITRILFLQHFPSDVMLGMLIGIWSAYGAAAFCNLFRLNINNSPCEK